MAHSSTTTLLMDHGLEVKGGDIVCCDSVTGEVTPYLDGSDVDITQRRENINAIALQGDDLLLSTSGRFQAAGLVAQDEDVFRFTPSSLGVDSQGSFEPSLVFDDDQAGFIRDLVAVDFQV